MISEEMINTAGSREQQSKATVDKNLEKAKRSSCRPVIDRSLKDDSLIDDRLLECLNFTCSSSISIHQSSLALELYNKHYQVNQPLHSNSCCTFFIARYILSRHGSNIFSSGMLHFM